MTKEPFENLDLPRKELSGNPTGHYRVYRDAANFVEVEAGTALQALEVSGIKDAYKIQRDDFGANPLLKAGALNGPQENTDPATPAVNAPEEKPPAQEQA